jgi:hypothetical protein
MIDAVLGGPSHRARYPQGRGPGNLGGRTVSRIGRRWAAGLVPVIGVVYDGWDARRSIDRVLRLPLDTHPRAWPA